MKIICILIASINAVPLTVEEIPSTPSPIDNVPENSTSNEESFGLIKETGIEPTTADKGTKIPISKIDQSVQIPSSKCAVFLKNKLLGTFIGMESGKWVHSEITRTLFKPVGNLWHNQLSLKAVESGKFLKFNRDLTFSECDNEGSSTRFTYQRTVDGEFCLETQFGILTFEKDGNFGLSTETNCTGNSAIFFEDVNCKMDLDSDVDDVQNLAPIEDETLDLGSINMQSDTEETANGVESETDTNEATKERPPIFIVSVPIISA